MQATLLTDFASAILINRCNEFIYIAAAKCKAKGSQRIWVDNTGESLQKQTCDGQHPQPWSSPASISPLPSASKKSNCMHIRVRTHKPLAATVFNRITHPALHISPLIEPRHCFIILCILDTISVPRHSSSMIHWPTFSGLYHFKNLRRSSSMS